MGQTAHHKSSIASRVLIPSLGKNARVGTHLVMSARSKAWATLPEDSLAHGQRVHLILYCAPHSHQLLSMPEQLRQIPLRYRRPPDLQKTPYLQKIKQMRRIPRVRLLLAHHHRANLRRVAHPPSCPSSAGRPSNQCVYPVASIPAAPRPSAQHKNALASPCPCSKRRFCCVFATVGSQPHRTA